MATTQSMSMNTPYQSQIPQFSWRFLLPQYWLVWIFVALLIPLAYLPWRVQFVLGKGLGLAFFHLAKRRRLDTLINLRIAFKEKTEDQRYAMAREVFINAGVGVFESLNAWFNAKRYKNKKCVTISGVHHIIECQQNNQSVIVMGAHFSMLDLTGLLAGFFVRPIAIVYRPQNNALLEWIIYHVRSKLYAVQIDSHKAKDMVLALNNKNILWWTPDQDFGLKQGVMAPFFGEPAATVIAQRRLANETNSAVLAVHIYRDSDTKPHYHITITSVLDNYPSEDSVADATRVNVLIEKLLRQAPTQYMWFHRRYKTRPEGYPKIY